MASLWFLMALVAGTVIPVQAGINAILARTVEHPATAALISFAVGTLALLSLVLLLRLPLPSLSRVAALPPWVWLGGGLLGAYFVVCNTFLAPRLGATVLVAAILCGQMLASVVLDHFGLLGYARHAVTPWRLLGVGFLVAGVVLIRRF